MHWSIYLRLIYLTAGTLLPFFWMIVILGHRRQRNFERVFFFLCLALVCLFGSSLLELNAELYYGTPPRGLKVFAWTFVCVGLWFIPPLLTHLHSEYACLRELIRGRRGKLGWLAAAYLPAVIGVPRLWQALRLERGFDFERPTHVLGFGFQLWMVASMAVAAVWQWRFSKGAADREQVSFHRTVGAVLWMMSALLLTGGLQQRFRGTGGGATLSAISMVLALVPFGILIGRVQRFNFLQIGQQHNLIYAVSFTFLALLYLSLVRRVSLWLEPYLPPEASAALLLFFPIVFFEPLQRSIRRLLQQTAQSEVDRAQRLMGPINEMARRGDSSRLVEFSERWIAEQLQLAEAKLSLEFDGSAPRLLPARERASEETFEIRQSERRLGTLRVRSHGAMVSGETYAALELVCEQLPAAFDLCRLIEEKLRLDRELAERERLALVGQMAASISHNLKNPLGAIKTILQVQLESPELPGAMRQETQMVLEEVRRLSERLNQLLQFSRPGAGTASAAGQCCLGQVAEGVVKMLRHDAENRGVLLELVRGAEGYEVAASAEAANDILSNVVLNAIEAGERGGHVQVSLHAQNGECTALVEDDGPGIPGGMKEKILQPFFSTKARGTGLGLAIVERRLGEIGGKLEIESPIADGRGSRFRVRLPVPAKDSRE